MTEAIKFWLLGILIVLFFIGNALVGIKRIRMERRIVKTLHKYPVASLPDTKEPK